jgi:hypothetical protein
MSHPHGTYLGGIRDLEDLRQRCRIDPDTGCWHWSLAMVQGYPKVHFVAPDTGARVHHRGPRAAQYLAYGHDLPPGHVAWRLPKCTARDCVNPGHVTSGPRQAHGALVRATGVLRGLPQTVAANTRIARTKLARLTPEQVREIRGAEGTHAELGRRYGIAASQIGAIRRGEAWRDALPGANVFSLLRSAA